MGVATSGGGDSMALLHGLLAAGATKPQLHVVHVNHNLRPSAATDAAFVEKTAHTLGLPCSILTWQPPQPLAQNTAQAARRARYGLMAQAAKTHGLHTIATAHTQNDVAETLLMRLGRGSGLAGAAAMAVQTVVEGCPISRPLLHTSRQELRDFLVHHNHPWQEDPTNTNMATLRARVRALLPQLEAAGVPPHALAAAAHSLRRADEALRAATATAAKQHIQPPTPAQAAKHPGAFCVLNSSCLMEPQEIQLRLIGHILAQAPHPAKSAAMLPRTSKRQTLLAALVGGQQHATLGGVQFCAFHAPAAAPHSECAAMPAHGWVCVRLLSDEA